MGKKDPVCPKCGNYIKILNGKVQYHRIPVVLTNGTKVKVKCPGIGKKFI